MIPPISGPLSSAHSPSLPPSPKPQESSGFQWGVPFLCAASALGIAGAGVYLLLRHRTRLFDRSPFLPQEAPVAAPSATPPTAEDNVRFYRLAAEKALRKGNDPIASYDEILKLKAHINTSELDLVTLALRVIPRNDLRYSWEWAGLASSLFNYTDYDVGKALDAATQWFIAGQKETAAVILGSILGHDQPTVITMNLTMRAQAALNRLEQTFLQVRSIGFDLLQRHMVAAVDAAVSQVMRLNSEDQPLADRLSPDVELAAALTEIIRSNGNAPLAMDQVVVALQVGALKGADPVEIRKALKGEPVSFELASALRETVPLHLQPEWRNYAKIRTVEMKSLEIYRPFDRLEDPVEAP